MAKRKKDTRALSIIINLVIVLWLSYSLYSVIHYGLDGNMTGTDLTVFKYYTIDSNIFAAISALVMFISRLIKGQPNKFATTFKYYGTCTVTITFLTVVFFLGPTVGYKEMFEGQNLYLHLIGPLLAIASFCFLDRGPKLTMKDAWTSLIPTFIYGVVYCLMVLIFKIWKDFYGFTSGGAWYVSAAVMFVAALVIAVILKALHNDKAF